MRACRLWSYVAGTASRKRASIFGGMNVSDAKRLKELEGENTRLKRALANAMLENEVIKVSIHQIGKQRGAQVALAEGWNDDHNQLASVFRSFGNFHCSPERGT